MAKKNFTYKGKTLEELQALSIGDFTELLPTSVKRKIARGFTDAEKALLTDLEKHDKGIKTHCRDMIVLPSMVGRTIGIYNGKTFGDIIIQPQMISHRLGEFSMTRSKIKHGAAGVASAIKH